MNTVTKNDEFKNFVDTIGNAILGSDAKDMDSVLKINVGNETLEDLIVSITAKIGEKISFRRFNVLEKNNLNYILCVVVRYFVFF